MLSVLQPDLSGALFVERSGTKKRERKAEIAAQIIKLSGEKCLWNPAKFVAVFSGKT